MTLPRPVVHALRGLVAALAAVLVALVVHGSAASSARATTSPAPASTTTAPPATTDADTADVPTRHASAPRTPNLQTAAHAKAKPGDRTGALFAAGSTEHQCTAAVVDSPHGNLVVTAAHCVSGTGAGMTFAPGWSGAPSSAGVWTVVSAYVDPAYAQSNSRQDDIAVLVVANRTIDGVSTSIESVTGGYPVATAPISAGEVVTVPAYTAGTGGQESCTARVSGLTSGFPTFTCAGYPAGVSGAPFLVGSGTSRSLAGVLGGLDQGGCTTGVSYATPAMSIVPALVARAASGAPGSVVPAAADDCS